MAMQGGLPMNWLTTQQFGDQIYNLQHENQFFNNFPSGIMPNHHQQQHILNAGVLPTNFSALIGLMSQGGFGQVPFGCGSANPHCFMALSSEQSYVQAPLFVDQGEMRPPSMQYNGEQFNHGSSRGRRPYHRGHHSFGHRGDSH